MTLGRWHLLLSRYPSRPNPGSIILTNLASPGSLDSSTNAATALACMGAHWSAWVRSSLHWSRTHLHTHTLAQSHNHTLTHSHDHTRTRSHQPNHTLTHTFTHTFTHSFTFTHTITHLHSITPSYDHTSTQLSLIHNSEHTKTY